MNRSELLRKTFGHYQGLKGKCLNGRTIKDIFSLGKKFESQMNPHLQKPTAETQTSQTVFQATGGTEAPVTDLRLQKILHSAIQEKRLERKDRRYLNDHVEEASTTPIFHNPAMVSSEARRI